MKEWIVQNLDWLVPCAIMLLSGSSGSAIISLVNSVISRKTLGKLMQDAQSRQTQVLCPKCHKKSPLQEVHFILPDGSVDDNLNGVADSQE